MSPMGAKRYKRSLGAAYLKGYSDGDGDLFINAELYAGRPPWDQWHAITYSAGYHAGMKARRERFQRQCPWPPPASGQQSLHNDHINT